MLARETRFIQRSTSRLTGGNFFNLLTVEILDEPTVSHEGTAWLAAFPRVLPQDSTYMGIHEKMADDFKGSGGNASTAAIKVDYSYDVKNEQAEHLAIRQGADSDQGFAEDLAARVQKNDLVIRDLAISA